MQATSLAMRKALPVIALILALGYLAPLSMFPWAREGASSFEKEVWFLSLAMLSLNAVGIGLLYRLTGHKWTLFALIFCGFQVAVWWWFSGIRSFDGSFGTFLVRSSRQRGRCLDTAISALLSPHCIKTSQSASFTMRLCCGFWSNLAFAGTGRHRAA